MASSAIEAIESSVVDQLATVPGMASVRAVPLSLAFKFREREDGTVYMEHHETPETYPGAIVCVNDASVEPEFLHQERNSFVARFKVPVVIAIYATSDGVTMGDAHREAWALYENTLRVLSVFSPTGMPDGTQSMGPLKPGDFEAIPIDANTHGIAAHFYATYQIETTG